ncbi:MAG: hydroxyacid dehydrogenase, partial [Firmicutes bacterium]|nr:hydroxyacid dehydrogenase [Bacillota bacterium]
MKIFVNIPKGFRNDSFITDAIRMRLASVAEVVYNEKKEQLSGAELAKRLKGCDVLMTGWGQPLIKSEDLGTVKLIVHTGGTIGGIIDMSVLDSDVTVISGNSHYAESVSEGVLAYMLYALRKMAKYEREMREGKWDWSPVNEGLLDKKVGIVSYGAISSRLIPKLKLFTDNIKVYSTHKNDEIAKKMGFSYATLEEIFSTCEVVSVHTAKNPETFHMINKKHFDLLSDGALFINTARGAVID